LRGHVHELREEVEDLLKASEAREREIKDKLFKTERNLNDMEQKLKAQQKANME
jgi:hypothetical protein